MTTTDHVGTAWRTVEWLVRLLAILMLVLVLLAGAFAVSYFRVTRALDGSRAAQGELRGIVSDLAESAGNNSDTLVLLEDFASTFAVIADPEASPEDRAAAQENLRVLSEAQVTPSSDQPPTTTTAAPTTTTTTTTPASTSTTIPLPTVTLPPLPLAESSGPAMPWPFVIPTALGLAVVAYTVRPRTWRFAVKLSPTAVGFLRGLIYSVLIAAGSAGVAFLDGVDAESITDNPVVLLALPLVARGVEGLVDKLRGQPDQVPLGSKPAEPAEVLSPTESDESITRYTVRQAVEDSMPRSQKETRTRVTNAVIKALRDRAAREG